MPTQRITITGKVQGVFFRAHTKEYADKLGITGWVRNLSDGSVEVHAEGSADALHSLNEWCAHGPDRARVDNIDVRETAEEQFTDFTVL